MSSPRLVVVRGNSGSGKTSLAKAIRAERPRHTVAIVSQDVIRRDILEARDSSDSECIGLIATVVDYATAAGRDVVLEGMLHAARYGDLVRGLVARHPGPVGCYLYDVTFDETLRRHATKPNAHDFGEPELRAWWQDDPRMPGLDERLIDEALGLDDAADRILRENW